jgi:ferritin-like protein
MKINEGEIEGESENFIKKYMEKYGVSERRLWKAVDNREIEFINGPPTRFKKYKDAFKDKL